MGSVNRDSLISTILSDFYGLKCEGLMTKMGQIGLENPPLTEPYRILMGTHCMPMFVFILPPSASGLCMKKHNIFATAAKKTADWTGRPAAFIIALSVVVVWGVTGPIFGYSDTWQLVINTGTTIVTFLMVFLIQNAQNRDTHALQIKLDELIRVTEGAHTALLDLEELDDLEICKVRMRYQLLAAESRKRIEAGDADTYVPELPAAEEKKLEKSSGRVSPKRKKRTPA